MLGLRGALAEAREWAQVSEDPYLKVGAVVIDDGRLVGGGYNQPPGGVQVDYSDREGRRALMVHAEVVALVNAGATAYSDSSRILVCNIMPCEACLTYAKACRVGAVYWADLPDPDRYPLAVSEAHAKRLNLGLHRLTE